MSNLEARAAFEPNTPTIIGGAEIPEDQMPGYLGVLVTDQSNPVESSFCSVFAVRWEDTIFYLTARHCIPGDIDFSMVVDRWDLRNTIDGEVVDPTTVRHPADSNVDLAVIWGNSPPKKFIDISNPDDPKDENYTLQGYGRTSLSNNEHAQKPRYADHYPDRCSVSLPYTFCSSDHANANVNQAGPGDSGGPVIDSNKAVGIIVRWQNTDPHDLNYNLDLKNGYVRSILHECLMGNDIVCPVVYPQMTNTAKPTATANPVFTPTWTREPTNTAVSTPTWTPDVSFPTATPAPTKDSNPSPKDTPTWTPVPTATITNANDVYIPTIIKNEIPAGSGLAIGMLAFVLAGSYFWNRIRKKGQ